MLLQYTVLKITSLSCIATYHTHIHTYILSANVCMRVCLCVCPPPRLLITSGVMWCDIDPYDWLNIWFYMAAVVGIVSGHDLSIHTHRENRVN